MRELTRLVTVMGVSVTVGAEGVAVTRLRLPGGRWDERVATPEEVVLFDALRAQVGAQPVSKSTLARVLGTVAQGVRQLRDARAKTRHRPGSRPYDLQTGEVNAFEMVLGYLRGTVAVDPERGVVELDERGNPR